MAAKNGVVTYGSCHSLDQEEAPSSNVIDRGFVRVPSKFYLSWPNLFCVLFTRWIFDINPKDLINRPSAAH